MKKIKLIAFITICIIIIQILMPILIDIDWNTVFAEDNTNTWDISKNGDGSVIAKLSEDGTLTISGSGNMKRWAYDATTDWHSSENKEKVKNVIINEGVTSIGDNAFYRCSSLTNIIIPEGVTSIGNSAFDGCSSLTNITIPEGVTSIKSCAFFKCSSLVDIKIPETVTNIGDSAFNGCSSLTNITIPEGVTSIDEGAFSGCINLTSITIPKKVTNIEDRAFNGCSSLTNITIPEGVTSIGNYAFSGCIKLTSITIPKKVTNIGDGAFKDCSSLTNITIPERVTSIGNYAFSGCGNLVEVNISEGVTEIKSNAFTYCSKLKSISIPQNADCANGILNKSVLQIWTTIEEGAKQEIPLPDIIKRAKNEGNNLYTKSEFTLLNCEINKDNTKLIINTKSLKDGNEIGIKVNEGVLEGLTVRVMIPEVIWDISKDENNNVKAKFDYNKKLLNITGDGKMKDFDWDLGPWYYLKDYIENVVIEDGVTNIGTYSFFDNNEVKNINLSKTIKWIDPYAFRGCDSLEVINIPEGTQTIGTGAFSACNNLNEVNIPSTVFAIGLDNVKTEWNEGMLEGLKITSTGEVFKDCINLKNINVNSNNKYYSSDDGVLYNKSRSNLVIYPAGKEKEKFEIPNTVVEIGKDAFDSCVNLKSIEIPGTVEKIEEQSFRGSNLSSIILNEGLKSIGEYAFYENTNIEEIYIPSSVKSIGNGALCKIKKLRKIEVSQDNKIYTSENGILLSKDKSKIIQYPANKDWSMYIIPDTVKNIESGAFAYGNNLKYLKINDNTNNIGTSAFVFSNLIGIYIPNSVESIETFNVAGDISPFYGCSNYTIYCNDNSYAKEYSVKYSLNYSTNIQEIFDKITLKTIKSISVTTVPTKMDYIVGQDFDKTGMIVTASYNDGSSKEVTDYEVIDGSNLAEGKTNVTISYIDNGITKTTTQIITVVKKELKEIFITKVPDNIRYMVGQDFDKTGMIITASYNDGSSKEVTDYEVVDGNNLVAGKANVTISYTENGITKTTTQIITVLDKIQIKIEEYVEDKKENISYIKKISPNTTIKEVIERIKTNGEIKIYKESQEIIDKNVKIATGMKIKVLLNNEQIEYETIVTGDLNGDGKIGLTDLANLKLSIVGKRDLNTASTLAGDINGDGKTSLSDLAKLKMYLVGKITI